MTASGPNQLRNALPNTGPVLFKTRRLWPTGKVRQCHRLAGTNEKLWLKEYEDLGAFTGNLRSLSSICVNICFSILIKEVKIVNISRMEEYKFLWTASATFLQISNYSERKSSLKRKSPFQAWDNLWLLGFQKKDRFPASKQTLSCWCLYSDLWDIHHSDELYCYFLWSRRCQNLLKWDQKHMAVHTECCCLLPISERFGAFSALQHTPQWLQWIQNSQSEGWRDGSVGKAFALQSWRLEFRCLESRYLWS